MIYQDGAEKVIIGATMELMNKMKQDKGDMDIVTWDLAQGIIGAMVRAVVYDRKDDVEEIVRWTKDNFCI